MKSQEFIHTYIDSAPARTMICSILKIKESDQIAFIIKEDPFHFDMVPKSNPYIEIRSGLIMLDGVALIPVLIQICHNPSLTYQEWFNFYDGDSNTKRFLHGLAMQEELYFTFVSNGTNPIKAFARNNNLQLGFRMYIQQLRNILPWSADDFELAKLKISRQYPFAINLWHGLKVLGEGQM